MSDVTSIIARLCTPTTYPAVLATLVRVEGSSYRRAGARLLLDASRLRLGSISGGCLEEDLLARMRSLDTRRATEVVVYDTTSENDLVWGVGLGCHGVVHIVLERLETQPDWVRVASTGLGQRHPVVLWIDRDGTRCAPADASAAPPLDVFIDRIQPPLALVVGGAGDDAQPLVRLAKGLGWTVTVVDPRSAHATSTRFPEADRVLCLQPQEVPHHLSWDERTAVVIMTHHYRFDRPLAAALLPLRLPYVGLLGPRLRAERILDDVRADGVALSEAELARVHAPVGLDIGGDGPEAVALAILAEIQATFAHRDARPLRQRQQPIHAA